MNATNPHLFFCDLPLVDINAISCSAARLIYHGSAHGAFGKLATAYAPINLHSVEAFHIRLEHLSSDPLSQDFAYHLVYLSKEIYATLWKGNKKKGIPAMKKMATHIHISKSPELQPKPDGHLFGTPSYKALTLTEYNDYTAIDNYVPLDYSIAFKDKFRGFILRTKSECDLLWKLMEAHGLGLVDQRAVKDSYDGDLQVQCYGAFAA